MSTQTTQPMTIVVVDDDAAVRTALAFTLELDAFQVVALPSGEDLLAMAPPPSPACILIDQNLTGMSGIETIKALRSRAVRLPALLMTSHPSRRVREAAADLNVVIVEKPLLGDVLLAEISAAMRSA
jgi:two-component system, LuxR family, response regulator FixJ